MCFSRKTISKSSSPRRLALCSAVGFVFLSGLSAADTPVFEIASIKLQPWTNEGRVGVFVRGDTLTAEHVDLYRLVEFAYNLRSDGSQVSGLLNKSA